MNDAGKFNIRGIPTLLVFKGGQVADQIVGEVPKERSKKFSSAIFPKRDSAERETVGHERRYTGPTKLWEIRRRRRSAKRMGRIFPAARPPEAAGAKELKL